MENKENQKGTISHQTTPVQSFLKNFEELILSKTRGF
jgi:hypothetical protein